MCIGLCLFCSVCCQTEPPLIGFAESFATRNEYVVSFGGLKSSEFCLMSFINSYKRAISCSMRCICFCFMDLTFNAKIIDYHVLEKQYVEIVWIIEALAILHFMRILLSAKQGSFGF